jgi:ABC-type sugar transport system ATPase subunit
MLAITGISKRLGSFSLKEISLKVAQGDYFVLLGVSGSGKTLLLETIAGLHQTHYGTIVLKGVDITYKRIQQRGVGIVFQDSSVFPHMSVARNIGYALKSKYHSVSDIDRLVKKWAERLDIAPLLQRMPVSLSGGELKRVALARTLAMEPEILLLDEPLSSLDVLLQFDMMHLLKRLNGEGQTIIHVTHDYHEAYALATHIAVMQDGSIVQQGTPAEVFQNPGNAFVAGLTGRRNYYQVQDVRPVGQRYAIRLTGGQELFSNRSLQPKDSFYVLEDHIIISRTRDDQEAFQAKVSGIFPFPGGANILLEAGFLLHAHLSSAQFESLCINLGDIVWIHLEDQAIIPVNQ